MKIVDLNVLLYLVNKDSVHHKAVRKWWERAVASGDPIGLAWIVIVGFVRLATSPAVFPKPLPVDAALAAVESWLSIDSVRIVPESAGHWEIVRLLLRDAGTAGNLTTDAHLAAIAIGQSATLVSCDRDFGRFARLRWEHPLA